MKPYLPIVLFIALQSTIAFSCKCLHRTTAQYFARSAAVFQGEVITVERIEGKGRFPIPIATLKIEKSWKGINELKHIKIRTSPSNCGMNFRKGKRYLLFVGLNGDGEAFTSRCSGSRDMRFAQKAMLELNERVSHTVK